MTMDMATLNTRVGWAASANSSLGWFRDNSKSIYRTYGLENMAGYYWYQSNIANEGWYAYNCSGYVAYATTQCCQDNRAPGGNCNCNCNSNCGTTYHGQCVNCNYPPQCWSELNPNWLPQCGHSPWMFTGVNCEGPRYAPAVCGQCTIVGNCDSRAWMQPNCNCAQCDCACNCGQCGGQCVQCMGDNGNCAMECTNCWACNCNCVGGSCFPAGTMVLMGDGTWRRIETIVAGEEVWTVAGPMPVVDVEIPILGDRKMLRFTDGSLYWSEEHPIWSRNPDGSEWLWTYSPKIWKREVDMGLLVGLKDNDSIRTGTEVEFAHINGFVKRDVEEVLGYSPMTQLYFVITGGAMIVANGYHVAGGTNEFGFDYTTIKWESMRPPGARAAEPDEEYRVNVMGIK